VARFGSVRFGKYPIQSTTTARAKVIWHKWSVACWHFDKVPTEPEKIPPLPLNVVKKFLRKTVLMSD
jgi:hypothetical protein